MSRPLRPVPREIETLSQRVALWRRTRVKRSPMPEALWTAAVAAARVHGIAAVARGAGLGYAGLQQRCAPPPARHASEVPHAGFVALPQFQTEHPADGIPATHTVVELRDGQGAQVTVRLGPGARDVVDVAALATLLWCRAAGGGAP